MPIEALVKAFVAGLLASLACGLGVLPLWIRQIDPVRHRGLGYAVAGGLMFAASVYNLILPGIRLTTDGIGISDALRVTLGILLGSAFLAFADAKIQHHPESRGPEALQAWGGPVGLLVFLAMTVHSIPEGVAVGVGYTSEQVGHFGQGLGTTLAVAIAIHNIPEGLAVGIPLRSAGAGLGRCFWAAVATSLPQPLAALPAVLLAWFFQPLMPILMGFAAGAMIYLVILELIPEALNVEKPTRIAWGFVIGFCLMLLIQVLI
jgi:ZIP family zinc transporter